VAAVTAVALAARVSVPVAGTEVPQSLQTLAVLVVGTWLGARLGALTLAVYVLIGGLGLPVFSDGGAGWDHLVGSSGGYLVGFIVAAGAIGACSDRGLTKRVIPALASMLGGHALILTFGWAWLATSVGAAGAFSGGVAPFLIGGVVKSLVGAAVVVRLRTSRETTPR
jgi:biotin transport system substrate-specific component